MHTCFAHFKNIINDQINICLMLLEERLFITNCQNIPCSLSDPKTHLHPFENWSTFAVQLSNQHSIPSLMKVRDHQSAFGVFETGLVEEVYNALRW